VPSLTTLGLSADAELLYRCLLAFGPQTVGRLERDLGLPAARANRGMDELASARAVFPRNGSGRGAPVWMARTASDVVPALRQRRHAEAHARLRRAALRQLVPEPLALGAGIRHLPSRALARARLAELVGVVRHEHVAMQPEPVYEAESARSAVPMDRALLTRGVQMRVLGAQPTEGGDQLVAYGRRADEARPDYRYADDVPTKLIVMDRRIALLPVSPDNLDRGYLEITQDAMVAALLALFERTWTAARASQEFALSHLQLTVREKTLVTLLAQGYTDASAAKAMRISRRAVSTTVRDLMDRFGVENRFQLGIAVGTLGAARLPEIGTPPGSPGVHEQNR